MLKFTLKLLLITSLFCSVALADGDQGSGGLADENNCRENCLTAKQTVRVLKDNQTEDYFLTFIKDFLNRILG
jgi:hypothetical protein